MLWLKICNKNTLGMNMRLLRHIRRKPSVGQWLGQRMLNLFEPVLSFCTVRWKTNERSGYTAANMKTVILKLSYELREKWRNSACKILKRLSRRTRFIDTVTFIESKFRIVFDTISGDIQNSPLCIVDKNVNRMKITIEAKVALQALLLLLKPLHLKNQKSLTRVKGERVHLQTMPAFVCISLRSPFTIGKENSQGQD